MFNMMNLSANIETIRSEANKKIVDAIWDVVNAVNSALDDAYGSGLGGHYASAMECAAMAVKYIEDVCSVLETENIQYGMVLDILGSIKLNNFDLPQGVVDGLRARFDKIRKAKRPVDIDKVDNVIDAEELFVF